MRDEGGGERRPQQAGLVVPFEGIRPTLFITDEVWGKCEVPGVSGIYLGADDDTDAPRYIEVGLTMIYRCSCCCSEATHQLPGGHCLMPSCRDEPCTLIGDQET